MGFDESLLLMRFVALSAERDEVDGKSVEVEVGELCVRRIAEQIWHIGMCSRAW